jgi:hypothetical protein
MANAQSQGGKATAKEVGAIAKSWEVSGDHDKGDECLLGSTVIFAGRSPAAVTWLYEG